MSKENLQSAPLKSRSGEVSEKGFGDVAVEESKTKQNAYSKDAEDRLEDASDEASKEEEEVQSEEVEEGGWEEGEEDEGEEGDGTEVTASIKSHTSGDIGKNEGEIEDKDVQKSPENSGEESEGEEDGAQGEERTAEEEKGKGDSEEQFQKVQSSSASALVVASILEEIMDNVFQRAEDIEPGEGLEGESEDEERREEEGEAIREQSPIEIISVTTIKSEESQVASIASEASDERRILSQEDDEQLRMDREAHVRQETFDRNVRLFNQYINERGGLKRKNAYLTRKMYEFYQQQKMEHLFKEFPSGNQEMEARYIRALLRYDELKNSADIEDGKTNALIDLLSTRYEELTRVMEEELAALEVAEKEVGEDLPYNYSAKTLQDKTLDKLIKNQLAKCAEVDEVRVKYFMLRDAVSAEESQLKALDDIGQGCTMKDYDQLRLHNQGCIEKLEERDAELEKLRTKALSAMQIFTEIREAAHATSEDIENEKRTLTDVERDLDQTRERLGSEKKRRDLNRFDTVRLQRETGLVFRPILLRDYKRSNIEYAALKETVAKLREKSSRQKKAMDKMRGSIKSLQE